MTVHRPPSPLGSGIRAEWCLDPTLVFLNHGSFGAAPRAVLEAQSELRQRIEADPIEMLHRRLHEHLAAAKAAVGTFLGMEPSDFGFVTNATDGCNAVLRSMGIGAGDELLTTNHVYWAVRQAMRYVAQERSAVLREVEIPLPLDGPEPIVSAIAQAISAKTRIVVVDHVTSPTAVVFPVKQIAELCQARGIDLLIDGAHAPGMLDLDVASIGATYYAGNLHKWVCAPKGSGFLWVRKDRQATVHPTIISLWYGRGFVEEFAWQGTRDPTPV